MSIENQVPLHFSIYRIVLYSDKSAFPPQLNIKTFLIVFQRVCLFVFAFITFSLVLLM